ncbi:MAG: phosphate-starvation-inducible PsiE family protein [Actinomycetes bacterium]
MSHAADSGGPPEDEPPRYVRIGNALLAITEDIIYVGIAAALAVAAAALLVSAAGGLADLGGDRAASEVVLDVLDTLLLVFIVVELLFAVRVILGKREVVAEPFLVVGIIASIKEIIVLSVEAAGYVGKGERFTHAIVEVGVLGGLVLVLAAAAILLRAKEKEPREGDESAARTARDDRAAMKPRSGEPKA